MITSYVLQKENTLINLGMRRRKLFNLVVENLQVCVIHKELQKNNMKDKDFVTKTSTPMQAWDRQIMHEVT